MTNASRTTPVLIAGAAYVTAGTGTALLAGLSSSSAVKGWRLAAWLLSLAVFCLHFVLARRKDSSRSSVASQVAAAVALIAGHVSAMQGDA